MMRPLLVVGPPGSGKSDLARRVASRAARPLRTADADSLQACLGEQPKSQVIDVSSGAWLRRETRVMALGHGVVVSVGVGRDGTQTTSNGESDDGALWMQAKAAFCEAHHVFASSRQDSGSDVDEVIALWRRDPIAVAVGERSYVVDVGRGILEERCQGSLHGQATLMLITDSNVERLHGARIRQALMASGSRLASTVFEAGEEHKHLGTLREIYDRAQQAGIDRSSQIIAAGGGVVTDIGGLAAATWLRGVKWLAVPTTLLGMVDASVGGKTAVDFGEAKNAIGAFWQPASVICDIDWLQTESERNYTSALAEVIKTAIVGDSELFEVLETERNRIKARDAELLVEVVRRCVRVKARVVSLDEREGDLRAVLNLGHTVGHALEAQGGFGQRTHGEAVGLGLIAALRLGHRLGVTSADLASRVRALLEAFGLPVGLSAAELKAASDIITYDKKRRGSLIKFVFAKAIGQVEIQPIVVEDLRESMASLAD